MLVCIGTSYSYISENEVILTLQFYLGLEWSCILYTDRVGLALSVSQVHCFAMIIYWNSAGHTIKHHPRKRTGIYIPQSFFFFCFLRIWRP